MARLHPRASTTGVAMLAHIGALAFAAGLGLAGCAGSGDGLDATGRPIGSGGDQDSPLTADFDSIQSHVLTPICTVCHAGGAAPQGLRLDAASSYALLVGVPSVEVPGLQRVRPGDPDASYLVQKLEGRAAVGARMPLGGPPLPDATIAVIRQWITDGAVRSAGVSASATVATGAAESTAARTPQLRVSAPGDGEHLREPPPRIVLGFDRPIDATRLDAATLRLERLSADHGSESVATFAMLADGDEWTVLLTPREPLAAGDYIVVTGGPGTSLSGLDPATDGPVVRLMSFVVDAAR